MSKNLTYNTNEDLEFDEKLNRIMEKFSVKLTCALFLDALGLLVTFLILDFSLSQYFLGFHIMSSLFEQVGLNDLRYPLRGIMGTFIMWLIIVTFHILGSIAAGIKERKRPDYYMKQIVTRYFDRVKEAKFKRN